MTPVAQFLSTISVLLDENGDLNWPPLSPDDTRSVESRVREARERDPAEVTDLRRRLDAMPAAAVVACGHLSALALRALLLSHGHRGSDIPASWVAVSDYLGLATICLGDNDLVAAAQIWALSLCSAPDEGTGYSQHHAAGECPTARLWFGLLPLIGAVRRLAPSHRGSAAMA